VEKFYLAQNYPNPFNPSTTIEYVVSQAGEYELSVYNLLGQKIRTLLSSQLTAGDYRAQWDGRNDTGQKVGSGIYFYRLSGKNLTLTRKMVLMR
jgi:flagellar hook assembly protein FlgD